MVDTGLSLYDPAEIRLLASFLYLEEGTLREEYLHRGVYHDMVRMSLLEREWLSRGARGEAARSS